MMRQMGCSWARHALHLCVAGDSILWNAASWCQPPVCKVQRLNSAYPPSHAHPQPYHLAAITQVRGWPLQPVDAAIRWLAGLPKDAVVADFGCGDARLAASVKQVRRG